MSLFSVTEQSYYSGNNLGNYQYITLKDIINNFVIGYVGEGKLISKLKRTDVSFHAQRALQELNYDTLRSDKSQEITVPNSLHMKLPHDYVNYIKVTQHDGNGGEKLLIPTRISSNPNAILQDSDDEYTFDGDGALLYASESETLDKFKNAGLIETTTTNIKSYENEDIEIDGRRYGILPEYAQNNGYFFIDEVAGKIFFSSNLKGQTITIKYVSDGVATESDMKVHKFAEEAVYKHVAYAVLSSSANVPEYIVNRYKKERFATVRKAKLRLSQLKSEEIAAVMKNKSKWIKH